MKEQADRLLTLLKGYSRILIVIQGSPDPDAMASSYVFFKLCEHLGVKAKIVAKKNLSLPVNREFVKSLDMPIHFVKSIKADDDFDAYAVMDHQSAAVEDLVLPCAVHIDHHEPAPEQVPASFRLIMTEAGSTCTIIALILKSCALPFGKNDLTSIATSLLYGIHTDTDKYAHAGEMDYEALNYISQYSDNEIIHKLAEYPLSRRTMHLIGAAIEGGKEYRDWFITGIGFIDQSERDSIPIVADYLLKSDNRRTVVVYAAVEDKDKGLLTLEASFRSMSEHINLNDIIKEITDQGGARKFKGAYQIRLDYFYHCPDRQLLWEILSTTTMEVLKKRRDGLYFTELKGVYRRMKDAVLGIFKKEVR